ncbi:ankyrin repeat domain-containing protein [Candidatus Phycorickettsia trachydisci]|nr:hypothetical protein [Candidatus Phycorickettsia trachydisci]
MPIEQKYLDLIEAVEQGDTTKVKKLLKTGIDVNYRFPSEGYNYELTGILNKGTILHLATERQNAQIMQTLVDAGADVNVLNNAKSSPFALAGKKVQHILLTNGANPKLSFGDNTPSLVFRNAVMKENDIETARVIARDTDVIKGYVGPLDFRNNILTYYLENTFEYDPKMIDFLLEAKADVNNQNAKGLTPLTIVLEAFEGEETIKVVDKLLKAGANPNMKDKNGLNYFDRVRNHSALDPKDKEALLKLGDDYIKPKKFIKENNIKNFDDLDKKAFEKIYEDLNKAAKRPSILQRVRRVAKKLGEKVKGLRSKKNSNGIER